MITLVVSKWYVLAKANLTLGFLLPWKENLMKYCFDIDGTICTFTDGNYEIALPYLDRIQHVNELISLGNEVIFHTARGSETGIDWCEFTIKQLIKWCITNPKIYFGKPSVDLYVDDRGVSDLDYFQSNKCSNC